MTKRNCFATLATRLQPQGSAFSQNASQGVFCDDVRVDRIEEKNLTKNIAGFDEKRRGQRTYFAQPQMQTFRIHSQKCRLAWRRSREESIVEHFFVTSLKSTHSRHFYGNFMHD